MIWAWFKTWKLHESTRTLLEGMGMNIHLPAVLLFWCEQQDTRVLTHSGRIRRTVSLNPLNLHFRTPKKSPYCQVIVVQTCPRLGVLVFYVFFYCNDNQKWDLVVLVLIFRQAHLGFTTNDGDGDFFARPRMAHGRLAKFRQELRHDLAVLVGFGERLGGLDLMLGCSWCSEIGIPTQAPKAQQKLLSALSAWKIIERYWEHLGCLPSSNPA